MNRLLFLIFSVNKFSYFQCIFQNKGEWNKSFQLLKQHSYLLRKNCKNQERDFFPPFFWNSLQCWQKSEQPLCKIIARQKNLPVSKLMGSILPISKLTGSQKPILMKPLLSTGLPRHSWPKAKMDIWVPTFWRPILKILEF